MLREWNPHYIKALALLVLVLIGGSYESSGRVVDLPEVQDTERRLLRHVQEVRVVDVPALATQTAVRDMQGDAPGRQGIQGAARETAAGAVGASNTSLAGHDPGASEVSASGEGLRRLIRSIFPASEHETALRIIACESQFDPEAIGDGENFGIMQLNAATWAPIFLGFWEHWMEPEWNVRTGYEIYKRVGYSWAPWECY